MLRSMVAMLHRQALKVYRRLPWRPRGPFLLGLNRALRGAATHEPVRKQCLGSWYELDLHQLIDGALYYQGSFEPATVQAHKRLVGPGMVVLDIGANVGCHTLHLARLVGHSGHVYAFEPTDWACMKLRRNLELNPDLENVTLLQTALSDAVTLDVECSFRAQWLSEGSIPEENGRTSFETLDASVSRLGLTRVDHIKLDVDGYETKVLRGGQRVLAQFKPTILIELSDYWQRKMGDSAEELLELIPPNYQFEEEATGTPIADIRRIIEHLPFEQTINVVCRPNASLSEYQ